MKSPKPISAKVPVWKTPMYKCWDSMKQRCNNKNGDHYKYYGERGIKVCKRWLKFENFLNDMGERPKGLQLERINNNGNYEPSNCKWADRKTQQNNRRCVYRIKHDGKFISLTEASKIYGISRPSIRYRIKNGWSMERALNSPQMARISLKSPKRRKK